MKVQIGEDTFLYPDVFVTCDRADLATDRVEGFRRDAQGQRVLHDMSDDQNLEAARIGASVSLAEVFDGVDPPSMEARPSRL